MHESMHESMNISWKVADVFLVAVADVKRAYMFLESWLMKVFAFESYLMGAFQ